MTEKKNELFDNLTAMTQRYSAPAGRVFIALIFFMSGLNKIGSYEATSGWMEGMGVSSGFLPLVIALEIFGGLAIILGWQTKIFAFLLAGFCILSALVFHSNFSDQSEMINFMKNVAIAGGFLFLVANGPGSYSLDNLQNHRKSLKK